MVPILDTVNEFDKLSSDKFQGLQFNLNKTNLAKNEQLENK